MSGFTINSVAVSGNLTRDPELRTLPSGTALCTLSIAVNERVKDNSSGDWSDRANFFDVSVWGGIGEWVSRNLHKGDGLAIAGRLRWRSWETKDGGKRSAVEIVAESIVPVPREGRSTGGSGAASPSGGQNTPVAAGDVPFSGGGMPGAEDDIPFKWRQIEWDDRYHANR